MTEEEKRKKRNKQKLNQRIYWRTKTFKALGDKCKDCGTTDRRVFSIDHPDGDGMDNRHGKNRKPNWKHYYVEAVTGTPALEIRCFNCHAIKDLKREV